MPAWNALLESDERIFRSWVPDGLHPQARSYAQIVIPEILRRLGLAALANGGLNRSRTAQRPMLSILSVGHESIRRCCGVWCAGNRATLDFERKGRRRHSLSYELPPLVHAQSWHRERDLLSTCRSTEHA